MQHEVFISHASQDKKVSDAMCARLEQSGLRCWVAPRDIRPGMTYGAEIVHAISNARAMVVILSGQANLSPHVVKEVERAVAKGIPVIPFRIEDILPTKDLEYFLSAEHWLDAITPPLEVHLQKLISAINGLLGAEHIKSKPDSKDVLESEKRNFEEVAPDEWRARSKGIISRWLKRLFSEKE